MCERHVFPHLGDTRVMVDFDVRPCPEPSRRRRLVGLTVVLAAMAAFTAAPAQAASLQVTFPQEPSVTVVQGSSSQFTLLIDAQGAIPCDTTESPRVLIEALYSLDAAGGISSAVPTAMPIKTTEQRGTSDNCYIETPIQMTLTATAAAETPVGEYTGVIRYGSGGDGDIDLDGPKLTIRVVPPDTPVIEPVVAPPAIIVLGERRAAPRPTLGKTVMLSRVRGNVTYRAPGKTVETLGSAPVIVPNGTLVDATGGVVKVTVVRNAAGALDSADVWGGAFTANQTSSSRPVTSFALAGALASSRKVASAARTRKARKRSLWVNGKGNFKTRGKRASAIVRGTMWLTEETTAGTKVSVKTGLVAVRDFVRHRTVLVGRNQSYTARPRSNVARRVPAFTGRHR